MSVGHCLTGLRVAGASVRERRPGRAHGERPGCPGTAGERPGGGTLAGQLGPTGVTWAHPCLLDEHVGPRPKPRTCPCPWGPACRAASGGAGGRYPQGGRRTRGPRREVPPTPERPQRPAATAPGPGPSSQVGSWRSEAVVCPGGTSPEHQVVRGSRGAPCAPRLLGSPSWALSSFSEGCWASEPSRVKSCPGVVSGHSADSAAREKECFQMGQGQTVSGAGPLAPLQPKAGLA